MKILYVNVIELNAGWGAEWFVDRAFRRLGHQTHCVDFRLHRAQLERELENAGRYDAFLLQRGDGFPTHLVARLEPPRLFWASELVSRCRDQDPLLASGLFDHVFLRSTACIAQARANGWLRAGSASVLLSGFDEEMHRPNPEVPQEIDVLFAGSMTPRRQSWLKRLGEKFNVAVLPAFGRELVELIQRSRIILNLHAEDVADTETRVFEVLGCGGFLLSERLSEENPFHQGELVQFETFEELCAHLDYYLRHDEERRWIAQHGHIRALAGHTYTHRARQILDVMEKLLAAVHLGTGGRHPSPQHVSPCGGEIYRRGRGVGVG